jgi:hypothetical protein
MEAGAAHGPAGDAAQVRRRRTAPSPPSPTLLLDPLRAGSALAVFAGAGSMPRADGRHLGLLSRGPQTTQAQSTPAAAPAASMTPAELMAEAQRKLAAGKLLLKEKQIGQAVDTFGEALRLA